MAPKLEWFILNDDGNPKPVNGMMELAKWSLHNSVQIAFDEIGEVSVSTVFIGHGVHLDKQVPTRMFETMVFGGERNDLMLKASTKEEALENHKAAVAVVRGG